MNYQTLTQFYTGREWRSFRKALIAGRIGKDGFIRDELTGKPIMRDCDMVLHHKVELTLQNVNDRSVSLNPENIMVVTPKSHNEIHNRWGGRLKPYQRKVYLIYGSPLAGKSTFVRENMLPGDLVLDMDKLWEAMSGERPFVKPSSIKPVVFNARNAIFDSIRTRAGSWQNAWVIEGAPLLGERMRRIEALGAEPILIGATIEECLDRLDADPRRTEVREQWKGYIEYWFRSYQPDDEAGYPPLEA